MRAYRGEQEEEEEEITGYLCRFVILARKRKHRNVTVSRTRNSLLPNNSRKCGGEALLGLASLLLDAPGRRDVDRKRTIIDRTL